MFYMVVTISEYPQSVQTSFIPATVFSRTSWTVFEWHFMHSLETVSGLGISILYYHQANLTLFHLPQLWNKVLQARRVSGGVAKPGQTRRTQDRICMAPFLLATHIEWEKKRDEWSRPLGVRGFESHPLHLTPFCIEYHGCNITKSVCHRPKDKLARSET